MVIFMFLTVMSIRVCDLNPFFQVSLNHRFDINVFDDIEGAVQSIFPELIYGPIIFAVRHVV